MSDSRLEKFIYAICSMDVSDLPVPLSRIEKLWNCLITGETPDFEPLSRNEKYLMAMLDRYDISNLPAPMSRGEKLLYKIAVGETDLSDVPGYLSRYEELLKYLIENGGIGFEYVLYTLNQSLSTLYTTAEKPVKSAILKGQTLVNHATDNLYITVAPLGVETITQNMLALKNNTEYIAIFRMLIGSDTSVYLHLFNNNWEFVKNFFSNLSPTKNYIKFTTPSSSEIKHLQLENKGASSFDITDVMVIEYEDGMENWDIPYFTGMQSVKMPVLKTTGKNLFDGQLESGRYTQSEGIPFADNRAVRTVNKIKVKPSTVYTLKIEDGTSLYNTSEYCNGVHIGHKTGTNPITFTTSPTTNELHLSFKTSNIQLQFQLEEGSQATSYEPYKTNILSTPSDLELRGIGNVQDTLDLLTGEVTERIGEIVLDETLDYQGSSSANGENTMYFQFDLGAYPSSTPISHYFKVSSANLYVSDNDYEAIRITSSGALQLRILKSKLPTTDTDGVKEFFKQNNISIQYQLAQESIKTVDLTTVDQDGQPTKLKSFNDITYVEINSDSIIPSVDLEVATKISETLSTMGLQHHELSETQNKLGQTIDEQAENTDATMMATTEIYEQTL